MINSLPLSLYLHIPWCLKKCPYCDFNSHKLNGALPYQEYINHILIDLDNDIPLIYGRTVNTIFIGGGTPNLLSPYAMQLIINGIRQRLPLALDAEITMEANPGIIETDDFKNYQLAGINRISIGVQSFAVDQLVNLNRTHSREEAKQAIQIAASLNLKSFNIDLMHGLPEQTMIAAINDLTEAINLNPPHISWYQLTIEPNTLFGSKPPTMPDDDTLWNIYQNGDQLLKAKGYIQYEISSYAYAGFECRHNRNYWIFGDYLGIGCGAHGKITNSDGIVYRTIKTRHPKRYIQGNYLSKIQQVSSDDLPFEYFMNRFRLTESIPRNEFSVFTGLSEEIIRTKLNKAIDNDYIIESSNYWHLTEKSKLFLNELLEIFM